MLKQSDSHFIGPVNPGNPLLLPQQQMQIPSVPNTRENKSSKSISSSKEEDIDALWGQTYGYELMDNKSSIFKGTMAMQLFDKLKNEHQGDINSFMNDPSVQQTLSKIHETDAKMSANKNAIKEEKKNYENAYSITSTRNGLNAYATDNQGNRFYIDKNTGERKTIAFNERVPAGIQPMTYNELYDYQRQHLSYDGKEGDVVGTAQQGDWRTSIDYGKKSFITEINQAFASTGERASEDGNPNVYASNDPGTVITTSNGSKSNVRNLGDMVSAMPNKLSDEAKMDGREMYWKEGWDKNYLVTIKEGENISKIKVDKDFYDEYISGKSVDEVMGSINMRSDLTESDKKGMIEYASLLMQGQVSELDFDKFVREKASAIASGKEKIETNTKYNFMRRSEAEMGAMIESQQKTAYDVLTNPVVIQKQGIAGKGSYHRIVRNPTDDNKAVLTPFDAVMYTMPITNPEHINVMNQWNSKLMEGAIDEEGEFIYENGKDAADFYAGQPIILGDKGGVAINPKLLKGAKIYKYGTSTTVQPSVIVDPDGNYSFDKTYDPSIVDELGMPIGGSVYQLTYIAVDREMANRIQAYLPGEAGTLENDDIAKYGSNAVSGDGDYTSSNWFRHSTTETGSKFGFSEIEQDGGFGGDKFILIPVYSKVNGGKGLNNFGDAASKHDYGKAQEMMNPNAGLEENNKTLKRAGF